MGAGKKGADLDDFNDSFNFDDVLGSGGGGSKAPAAKQTSFGAKYSGVDSTKNLPPRRTNDDTDDSFFGIGPGS